VAVSFIGGGNRSTRGKPPTLVYYRKASNLKGITPLVDRKLLKLFGPSRHFALDSKLAK
jgi:hypothetical protein